MVLEQLKWVLALVSATADGKLNIIETVPHEEFPREEAPHEDEIDYSFAEVLPLEVIMKIISHHVENLFDQRSVIANVEILRLATLNHLTLATVRGTLLDMEIAFLDEEMLFKGKHDLNCPSIGHMRGKTMSMVPLHPLLAAQTLPPQLASSLATVPPLPPHARPSTCCNSLSNEEREELGKTFDSMLRHIEARKHLMRDLSKLAELLDKVANLRMSPLSHTTSMLALAPASDIGEEIGDHAALPNTREGHDGVVDAFEGLPHFAGEYPAPPIPGVDIPNANGEFD